MDLPCTDRGNKHAVVFQDMFTKWPVVFPVPDQKAERVTRLRCEEIIPMFGVPEALLSDRGTNLLSHLMLDVCAILGIEKINTTSYHPECDGMVERFNRTLKTILCKRAAQFGTQWDNHLTGVLWAYRNTPHSSTGEKPSLDGIAARQQNRLCFQSMPPCPLRSQTIGKSWFLLYHQPGELLSRISVRPRRDIKFSMIPRVMISGTELATGC